VLMPGCSYDVAVRRAQNLVALISNSPLLLPGGAFVALSISAGVSYADQLGGLPGGLYASADAALYVAKRGGRGRVGQVDTDAAAVTAP
jgi:GGDEF domain-containing protein